MPKLIDQQNCSAEGNKTVLFLNGFKLQRCYANKTVHEPQNCLKIKSKTVQRSTKLIHVKLFKESRR